MDLKVSAFRDQIANILEVDRVEADQMLADFEAWDSLAALSIVAAVHKEYRVLLTSEELARISTIGDLEALVRMKIGA